MTSAVLTANLLRGGLVSAASVDQAVSSFSHRAVLYRGIDDFVRQMAPFVAEGVARDEPVLVVEPPSRVAALRVALGEDARWVEFMDMEEVGGNPGRIIGEWRRFVGEHAGERVRGVGEPAWAGRRAAELEECRLHESLLNVAFDDGPGWELVCPYDVDALADEVVRGALCTHPVVSTAGEETVRGYGGHAYARAEFTSPLPAPPEDTQAIAFTVGDLAGLRSLVQRVGSQAGLHPDRVDDLVLAAHELACNSIEHGHGAGVLRAWEDAEGLVVELGDDGVIENLLVGREPAMSLSEQGRGVWMANQLCDLVRVRSSSEGTTVRLHSWRPLVTPGR